MKILNKFNKFFLSRAPNEIKELLKSCRESALKNSSFSEISEIHNSKNNICSLFSFVHKGLHFTLSYTGFGSELLLVAEETEEISDRILSVEDFDEHFI